MVKSEGLRQQPAFDGEWNAEEAKGLSHGIDAISLRVPWLSRYIDHGRVAV